MQAPTHDSQREYDERKLNTISSAFASMASGILWLSLNVETIRIWTCPIGIGFLGLSLFLIVASFWSRLLPKAESFMRKGAPILWPLIVVSVVGGLHQALPHIKNDWRLLTLGLVVVVFMFLTIMSLVIISTSRMKRRDYKWTHYFGLSILLIAFALVFYSDFPSIVVQAMLLLMGFVETSVASATSLDWQVITGLFSVLAFVVVFGGLTYAIVSGRKQTRDLSSQTELLRKQVFGDLYDAAQVTDLRFVLPAKWKYQVRGFNQQDEEQSLGDYVAIPVDRDTELHILWQWAENQTMIGFNIGFKDSTPSSPEILRRVLAFQKQPLQEFTREEYIDWHGWFHTEYAHLRRFAKGDYFATAIEVNGKVKGKYTLCLEVKVHEAPNYVGELTVECLDLPNRWAKQHWTNEYLGEYLGLKPQAKR